MSLPSIDKSSRSSRTGAFDFEAAPAFLIYLGRAITLVAITLAPWFFGCVRFQEQVWLYSAMTIAAVIATIVVTIRAIKTPEAGSLRFPLLAIPMIAGIGLGAVQLLPAEQELTTSRVTQSAELAQWDLGEPIKSTRYSFYPHLTVLEIARYTFATVAFFIGYTLFRTPSSQRLLWAWLLGNGLVLAAFGIIQKFSWNGKLFWNVVLSNGGDPFASFVNRNNAMAFLYITIAAGLGLLAWSIERRPVRATTGLLSALLARVAALEALQVCLLCGLVLLGAGIIASTSRSGALCACIAGLVVVVFTSVRRRSAWPLVVAGLGLGIGTAAVLTLEVNDQLAERIARVDTERLEERTRVRHAKDALGVTKALPVLGSGLGTHRYAYLPFVSEFGRLWAFNADNQYVEIAVETGLSGLAIVTLLVLLTCWLIASGRKTTIESAGTGVAAIFLLCSQLFHGLFDFGIILPATLLATSVMIGTAVASVSSRTGGRGASAWSGRWALPSTMLAILTLSVGGVNSCKAAATVEAGLSSSSDLAGLTNAELDFQISNFEMLPGAESSRHRGKLLIERYERQARAEIRKVAPELPADRVEALASVDSLFVTIQRLRRNGQTTEMRTTRGSKPVVENLRPALASFREAAQRCSILPDNYAAIGQLSSILGEPDAAAAYKKAVLLEPYDDKVTTLVAADLLETTGTRSLAASVLRHGLSTVRWRVQRDVLDELDVRYGLANILNEVCPRSGFAAARLATRVPEQLREKTLRLGLAAESNGKSLESLLAKAHIHAQLRDPQMSLQLYQQAAADYPASAEAHYRLAGAFKATGDLAAALASVRVAAALDPDGPGYAALLEELESGVPGTQTTSHIALCVVGVS